MRVRFVDTFGVPHFLVGFFMSYKHHGNRREGALSHHFLDSSGKAIHERYTDGWGRID